MTIIIQLPYYPGELFPSNGKTEQIESVKRILSQVKGLSTGIQIFMGTSAETPYREGVENFESFFSRLQEVIGDEMWQYSTLHLPICPKEPEERLHLGKPGAVDFYKRILKAVNGSGLTRLILHPNTVYYLPYKENEDRPNYEKFVWGEESREEAKGFVDRVIELAEEFPELNFAYENMPLPIRGDFELSPKGINIEPNFMTLESINDFLERTKDHKNVSLCFDFAHYLITKETIEYLISNPKLLDDIDIRTLVGSISSNGNGLTPSVEESKRILDRLLLPSLVDFIRKYSGRITDVQVTDTLGAWQPSILGYEGKLIKEGLPLVEGENNYDIIMESISILKEIGTKQDITVSVDVSEFGDRGYIDRPNQRETLQKILKVI